MGEMVLFEDLEEKKRRWGKFPVWSIALFFFLVLILAVTLSYFVLFHSVTIKQFLTGAIISLLFSIAAVLFLRGEYSNEDLVSTFANSMLLALAFFLVAGFIVMLVVILGPHIAAGLRLKAMNVLDFSFQQIATSFLFTSAIFISFISLIRIAIKK